MLVFIFSLKSNSVHVIVSLCYFGTNSVNLILLLIFVGVAHVPFDPNDMPTAKDVKPWWEVLQEFFVDE